MFKRLAELQPHTIKVLSDRTVSKKEDTMLDLTAYHWAVYKELVTDQTV